MDQFDTIEKIVSKYIKPHIRLHVKREEDQITTDSHIGFLPGIEFISEWPHCEFCEERANFLLQVSKPSKKEINVVSIYFCQCGGKLKFFFEKRKKNNNKLLNQEELEKILEEDDHFPFFRLEFDVGWNAPCLNNLKILSQKGYSDIQKVLNDIVKDRKSTLNERETYDNFRYHFDLMALENVDTMMGFPEGFHFSNRAYCNNCGKELTLFLQLNEKTLSISPLRSLKNLMIFECSCKDDQFKALSFSD